MAEAFEAFHVVAETVKGVAAQLGVAGSGFQYVIDDHQDRMSHRDQARSCRADP
jgi:hypothetical protein